MEPQCVTFERCRDRLVLRAPVLLASMEALVKRHPLLSGDLVFYATIERLLQHAPAAYLPTLRYATPTDMDTIRATVSRHDFERSQFFCRSKRYGFPKSFYQQECAALRARLKDRRAKANPCYRAAYQAALTFYRQLGTLIWREFKD